MPFPDPRKLADLVASHDLETLKGLARPIDRSPNRSLSFRSAMMVSAHNVKHLSKIPSLQADCLMLNLEDGVAPEHKPYALVLCAIALASFGDIDAKLVVRINPLEEGGAEEIAYLNPFMPDAIRIPKIRSAADVQRALALIDEEIEVHLSIETKEAWLALGELACSPRVRVYYLGMLDLFADLGLPHSLIHPDNPTMHYLLSHFLVTSRAFGVKPVSFVYQDHKNLEELRYWVEVEKTMGYEAKGCISPAQVEVIHDILGRWDDELSRAGEIVRLFEENAAMGITGFVHERYGFVDEPIYKGALSLLKNRQAI